MLFQPPMLLVDLKSIVMTVLRSFSPAQSVRPDVDQNVPPVCCFSADALTMTAEVRLSFTNFYHRFFMRASDLYIQGERTKFFLAWGGLLPAR